ncbi:lactonase family protein [Streptomyces pristinaespiralis]|uniref:Secreted protein n=3 Tax=Streptomyces TaxID=1883 RepID=D6X7Z8_STRE2|nr:lactonase family protein [Streptomyces pristinaespiralis]ALC18521.1 putative secreted protein [Streptomyces pristinaespiralis]ALC25444.1 putative secreted protein [Streptomyces pristinaespiralis]EFH32266.1 secreted protein [Streptomyces pristinaespiralis ATCC 25486]QMU12350.1 lactonase family protein [Streptomyces pristinaespiralis]CBW45669.1 putative secreted protein [Streptomyces pristinaespiralis]
MNGTVPLRAFIGCFTTNGGRGIVRAAVDPRTGALTAEGTVETVPDPSYLAVGHRGSGPVLYCVSETAHGAVAGFDVSGPVPRPLGEPVATGAADPTHLAVCHDHLVTADYGSGSVTVLPLAADGSPLAPSSVLRHEGSGPDRERQSAPHAHQVVQDPSGGWVLSVDLGTDSVRVCSLDPGTGQLALHSVMDLPPGTGPRHLVFHPRGSHAYVLGELRPTVTVCRWDAASGVLLPVGEFPLFPDGAGVAVQPSAPVVSRDGRHLWAAVRGTDTIEVLSLDETGEVARVVTSVPCGGHWPRDLVLHPSGAHLYAANERSGDVTWFDVDATGVPRRAGSLAVPAASSVAFA